MAVITKLTMPGLTKAQYDTLRAKVDWLSQPPIGGILHVAWWEGNDAHALDVWESAQDFENFGRDRMAPAMQALGINEQSQVEFAEPHEAQAPQAITWVAPG